MIGKRVRLSNRRGTDTGGREDVFLNGDNFPFAMIRNTSACCLLARLLRYLQVTLLPG